MTNRGGGAAREEVGWEGDGGHATSLLSAKLITRGEMLRFAQHDETRRGGSPRGSPGGRGGREGGVGRGGTHLPGLRAATGQPSPGGSRCFASLSMTNRGGGATPEEVGR